MISNKGLELILHFEGFSEKPYLDQKGIPTIGIGTIAYPNGKKVTMKDSPIDKEKAIEYLNFELKEKTRVLNGFLISNGIIFNKEELSSLICFVYNLGCGPVIDKGRTMHEAILSKDKEKIYNAFLIYNKINKLGFKIESKGLTRRRKSEAHFFKTGELKFFEV